jgi:hypothetical protein
MAQKLSFSEWMGLVEEVVKGQTGLCTADLPDVNYAEMWESGTRPRAAANKAVKNANEG